MANCQWGLGVATDGISSNIDAPCEGFSTGPLFGCVHFEDKNE